MEQLPTIMEKLPQDIPAAFEHPTFPSVIMYIDMKYSCGVWNHPTYKIFKYVPNGLRYELLNSTDHTYIKYLEDVLAMFTEWFNESKVSINL